MIREFEILVLEILVLEILILEILVLEILVLVRSVQILGQKLKEFQTLVRV